MVKEIVTITGVFGDTVEISFTKRSMCDSCKAAHVCSRGTEHLRINANGFVLREGDRVEVQIDEKKHVLAGVLTFLLPAGLFLGGLILFEEKGETMSFLLALALIFTYYVFLKLFLIRYGKSFEITIINKINNGQPSSA